MSKQCKIIKDLLPLYHDGVCSAESRELVDAHLSQCEDCRKTLEEIDSELLLPPAKDTDVNPLRSITKTINHRQKKALIKGIAITLSLILIVFVCKSIGWYTKEYNYYAAFAKGHSPMLDEPIPGVGYTYSWEDDAYIYFVTVPSFLSKSGDVRIDKKDKLFFRAAIGLKHDVDYVFQVDILCQEPEDYHKFFIDGDLNLYQWNYRYMSDSEKTQVQAELDAHREEIQELIDAAKAMWPFIA